MAGEITEDAALGGRLRLRQPRRGHRFGHDGVLLAAATEASAGDHVVDLGAGVGIAGLALAARVPGTRVTLVERDARLAELAAENIALNGFAARMRLVCADLRDLAADLAGLADRVMMNPPFNDPLRMQASPDAARAAAHVGGAALLAGWVAVAASLLRQNGALTLIWRGDDRAAVLDALRPAFGAVRVLPVCGKPDTAPIRDLFRAEKGGPARLTMLLPLLLNAADGRPTQEAEQVLRHAAALPLSLRPLAGEGGERR